MEKNELKLNFLKRILTDTIDSDIYEKFFEEGYPSDEIMEISVKKEVEFDRMNGLDWPLRAHTMIGIKRLDNLHKTLDYVRINKVDGDLIETGVWRGGATIFMKAYLELYDMDKKVFVCDSFEGLPKPDIEKYPVDLGDIHHTIDYLKVPLNEVMSNFEKYKLLDEKVIFIKGWFSETLKNNNQISKISILRFDGDMYGSTIDVLENLYEKIDGSGVIIIDDYCLPNCVRAVSDFRERKNINKPLQTIDKCGVFWFK
jgi:O-methyltransferase